MQEFLEKVAIWDFFEMTRDEFTSKSDFDRELLIIKYYNSLLSGILLLFVIFCLSSVQFDSTMIRLSPVRLFLTVSSSEMLNVFAVGSFHVC